jgi:two-component system response regulator AtoC
MANSILIVDDEQLTLRTISRALRDEGFEVLLAETGERALELFAEERPDLALVDVVLPGLDGLEVLRRIKEQNPAAIVLMMSAYHVVERAVEAMKLGAYDYLVKPFRVADMVNTIRRAMEVMALRVRITQTIQSAQGRYDFGRIVTRSQAMAEVLDVARKAAASDRTTILIQGESGTGKEVLAKAIHYHSPRSQMPIVELNCAALPETLLESELFGYEPGAFTDARRRKEGLIERAHTGTLFFDEIGNMSASVQAKLLRVLEEGNFTRLGGTRPIEVDVRIIAATNANLHAAVDDGHFREDLFYRLNVLPIFIPPLRERREDIIPLALDMMRQFNRELKKSFTGFSPAAAASLEDYRWPGNIRELKNVVERTMILAPEGEIDVVYLPREIRKQEAAAAPVVPARQPVAATANGGNGHPSLREVEERYIQEVLAATHGNKTQAARILKIHPTSLLRRLKKNKSEPPE